MSKVMTRHPQTGQFVLGRRSAEKISAVEGLVHTERTARLVGPDRNGESGEIRRVRIKAEFKK